MSVPASFAVIGDVHACDIPFSLQLRHLRRRELRPFSVGNLVPGHSYSGRAVELLVARGVTSVLSNHDEWVLDGFSISEDSDRLEALAPATAEYLRALPRQVEFDAAGVHVSVCHGLGENTMNPISA